MLHMAVLATQLEPVVHNSAGHWQLGQVFFGGRPDLLSA